MLLIIFGETHKVMDFIELKDKKYLESLLREEYKNYTASTKESTLYSKGYQIKGKAFNYLNSQSSTGSQSIFRPLISKVFSDLESIYPSLGEEFIDIVMDQISNPGFKDEKLRGIESNIDQMIEVVKKSSINLSKKDFNYFIKNEISPENRKIIRKIIDTMSVSTRIFVEETHIEKNVIIKTNNITFNLEFDSDFLLSKNKWESNDYNFVIIDGFIDTVGEIYHLLQKASEDKEPYVVFCKGMKPEVKDVLIQNIKRGTINVFPVSLDINELNVNILVDIAMLHNSDVVNSLKGETISIVVRRKLKKGRQIVIDKNTISFEPLISDIVIAKHLNYLEKRKQESCVKANDNILEKRIKILSADKLIVKIHKENLSLSRDIRKTLFFLKTGSSGVFYGKKNKISRLKIIPTYSIINLLKKTQSFLKTIYTTDCAVIISNEN
tara:strand:+ start:10442 stop:11758 length:1317 start_codon:yes stop_codon:yes gene_type:complete